MRTIRARVLAGFGIALAVFATSAASNWVAFDQLGTEIHGLRSTLDTEATAINMDLITQRVRVRVNQWLRSMDPAFAKQADEQLALYVALVAKVDAATLPGKSKEAVEKIANALKAYIISWNVIQQLYAEEAQHYIDKIERTGDGLQSLLSEVRDQEIAQNNSPALQGIISVKDRLGTALQIAARYRITGKPADAEAARTAIEAAASSVKQAIASVQVPEDTDRAKQVLTGLTAWRTAFEQLVTMDQTRANRLVTWTRDEGEVMAVGANELHEVAAAAAAVSDGAVFETLDRGRLILGGSTGAALLISIVSSLVLARSITRPVGRMTAALKALAAGQDTIEIPETGRRDEIGEMAKAAQVFKENGERARALEQQQQQERLVADSERARRMAEQQEEAEATAAAVQAIGEGLERLAAGDVAYRQLTTLPRAYESLRTNLNRALEQLHELVGQIVSNSSGIRSGTEEIARAADDLSKRTETQAAGLEETAAALDEITVNIRKTAAGAQQAHAVVTLAKTNAAHSGEVVRDAIAAMSSIEASSGKISQIIGVIDEIAFQTNLLALNAGVEAARAGDAGRGFAVVASEVRALAQRSAEAAKEIKALISASARQVTVGVKLVGETGDALTTIVAQVGEITALIAHISTSAQEQATGLVEVNSAVNQMDQTTQQNAAMVEQTTAASHSLAQEAEALARLTSRFDVGGDARARQAPRPRFAEAS